MVYLVSATTGLDHIEQDYLQEKNIKLISLRGHDDFLQTIPSTAEHTWALLLSLMRNIPAANEHVKTGMWERDKFKGHQLKGKTLGIIGLGRTGKKVATFAKAFDMSVQYFDPYVHENTLHKCERLETLLGTSDIITLHIHLNSETENLLGRHNLMNLKKGALLINTSRGKVLDENAICDELISKKIAGIATDVLNNEWDDIKFSRLWQAQQNGENVIITPHIGGATIEGMWACEEFITSLI